MPLDPGTRLGSFEVIALLGSGGMGEVHKALDTKLNRTVALKLLPPDSVSDPQRRKRFVQEAQAASALDHPNIITIHEVTEAEGHHFIVMQYVPGLTLRGRMGEKGLDVNEALGYAVQMADGLAAAHSKGIVHRDLKPDNVMVHEKGQVKILDFGLAKLTEPAEPGEAPTRDKAHPLTQEGHILGTVAYMSPEQAQGKKVDARSDIFSFGSVLYEMLTGQPAFAGDNMASVLASIIRDEPERVGVLSPGIPSEVERVVNRCLRKDPERRFQSMADVRVELEEIREETDSGRSLSVLIGDEEKGTQSLRVLKDPHSEGTEEDIRLQTEMVAALRSDLNDAAESINEIEWIRKQLEDVQGLASKVGGNAEAIVASAEELSGTFLAVEEKICQVKLTGTGQDRVRWPTKIAGRIAYLAGGVAVEDFRPTDQHREVHEVLKGRLASAKQELQQLKDNDLPAFNRTLEENG